MRISWALLKLLAVIVFEFILPPVLIIFGLWGMYDFFVGTDDLNLEAYDHFILYVLALLFGCLDLDSWYRLIVKLKERRKGRERSPNL